MELELIKKTGTYSIEAFKESWILGLRQFLPLFVAWLMTLVVPLFLVGCGCVIGMICDKLMHVKGIGGPCTMLFMTLPLLLIGFFWTGWIYVTLKIARGERARFLDLFRPIGQVSSGFIVLLITSFLIGWGTVMFVLPGALLFLKFQLAPYFIVDQDAGPIEALKESWKATNSLFMPLALLDLAFCAVQSVSAPTVIGPFLCHMVLAVATGLVYAKWVEDETLPQITNQLFRQITGRAN